MKKKKIIVVVGPTASGKTALAISLAKEFNGEIISADSMQIYKDMNIATAKPTTDEMSGIPHHLIDFLPPTETFSVADFVTLAKEKIDDVMKRGKTPIIAGGTGLYIDTLINNINLPEDKSDDEYRAKLQKLADEKGNDYLLEMLKDVDPKMADTLHANNQKRIIRALEIYKNTGIPMSEHIEKSKLYESDYNPLFIGLNFRDREKLYQRINLRVDKMIEAGLLKEAKDFYNNTAGQTATSAIGYKELKPYLDGGLSLDECVDKLKMETRRYAKRQLTWFRKNENINWLYPDDYNNDYNAVINEAKKLCIEFLK